MKLTISNKTVHLLVRMLDDFYRTEVLPNPKEARNFLDFDYIAIMNDLIMANCFRTVDDAIIVSDDTEYWICSILETLVQINADDKDVQPLTNSTRKALMQFNSGLDLQNWQS